MQQPEFRLVDEGFTDVRAFHYNDALIDQTSAVQSTLVFPTQCTMADKDDLLWPHI